VVVSVELYQYPVLTHFAKKHVWKKQTLWLREQKLSRKPNIILSFFALDNNHQYAYIVNTWVYLGGE
jgi:hypothetical protein